MRRTQLDRFYQRALDWTQAESPVDWAIYDPHQFDRLSSQTFVENYCWVIYVSGFEVAVVESHWPSIQSAYKEFDLSKLVRMRGVSKRLLKALPIKNERKALGFLNGCRIVADWGWEQYKAGLRWEWKRRGKEAVMEVLEELPYIGSVTKYHLGMDIGLDVAKPDRHVTRTAEKHYATVSEMVSYLSNKFGHSRRYVDGVIFEYCRAGPGT